MPPKKQKQEELINWYDVIPKKFLLSQHNPNYDIHKIKIPFRMLIVGSSGAGKTQTLLNIIHNFNNTFNNIVVITKNKDEPLYNYLEDKLKDGVDIREGINNAPNLDDFDKEDQTLIVMDDLVLEKNQNALEQYFIRARKLNCSLIYISQSYYRVPRIIRQNLNYLIIKQLSSLKDLYRIMGEYSLGVDKEQLNAMYKDATSEKQSFLMVDMDADMKERFRKNFNNIYDLEN
jgi:ABC-type dipeptide/oligopeptide/nickel transport system ATPase component